ncbi:MAG: TIGR03087 family PEP-CTERM/XrtA system glycosyltransferase [Burkholderiaceae bacterium]
MESLIYLVHRIPYPPNKGDKIRSFHLLRHLASRYRVFLGCFVDQAEDLAYMSELARYCQASCVLPIPPRLARIKSLTGLARGEALSLPYYRAAAMRRWVETTVAEHGIARAVVFSAVMAQYLDRLPALHAVIDYCDVDSAKWSQYAADHAWPRSWIYRREGQRLLAFEREVAARSQACVFATEAEAQLFAGLAPEAADKLHAIDNGVDTTYFAPAVNRASPYAPGEQVIVFTGAMDYWPNIDAVSWFARNVLPRLAERHPAVRFVIVGMNPAPAVLELARDPRITVTGKVADVRPYVQHARVVVAPLRVARGIQNKVLEAMAMARPVVVSAACAEGLHGHAGVEFAVAATADDYLARVNKLLEPYRAEAMGLRARARILADRDWERNLARFDALLESDSFSGERAHAL